ncbi:MAG TPA: tetratricopeptide repeat protein [Candidatus Gastranaerophilales bacterium]|nr:tetratricopeptide repeat protein [Candidatus Gastranaerophilales bacterium]
MSEKKNPLEKITNFINLYKFYLLIAAIIVSGIFFMNFPAKNPTTINEMIEKAETYKEQGKMAFALEEYNNLVRLYPNNYDIHLNLAEVYLELNEVDKAKIEYIRAIKLGNKYRFDAEIALAKIYGEQKRYDIVKDILKNIDDVKKKKDLEELGNICHNWGIYLKETDRLEAIRKFKEAHNYYKKAKSKLAKNALEQIKELYAGISDTLVEYNETQKAIEILNLSIAYEDNALAHYKLAKIYEKTSHAEKALEEYSKSFALDDKAGNINAYISLLMKRAKELHENGDITKSKLYYLRAKKLDSKINIPENAEKQILFNLIATKINEDMDKDILIPGIVFKFNNITKDAINNLKVKIVFTENDKELSAKILTIATEKTPIKADAEASKISVYSDKPVKHVFDDHDLTAQIYISQQTPDEWKLLRKIEIIRERKPVQINE